MPDADAGDPAKWPSFWVPKGELLSLLADERSVRAMASGVPFIVTFADEDEGRDFAATVLSLLEARGSAVH